MRAFSMSLVAVLALAACGSEPSSRIADGDAARLLIDRNWIDHMPQSHSDRLHVFRFVPTMGGGVFQDRTLYAGHFELFRFTVAGNKLAFDLPFKKQQVNTSFEIRRVQDHEPFDLQLTLANDPRGPRVYYGFSNESAAEADVETLLHTRAPAPPAPPPPRD
jgi:hypothetical protein